MAAPATSRTSTAEALAGRLSRAVSTVTRRGERIFYRRAMHVGRRAMCPVCGWQGLRFRPSSKPRVPNRLCPGCGSSERYRALELWLRRDGNVGSGGSLLEIAPIRLVEPTARSLGFDYVSLDLRSPRARVLGDLCRTPFHDGAFDVIVCFHVLEHIPDDVAAMAEIRRLLSPDGVAVVVVPWEPGRPATFEDATDDPAEYERVYGQSDHVRIYGADVTDRLRSVGMDVEEVPWSSIFTPDVFEHYRLFGDDDRFWICRPGG